MQRFPSMSECIAHYGCYSLFPLPSNSMAYYSPTAANRSVEWCGTQCRTIDRSKLYTLDIPSYNELYCYCITPTPTSTNFPNSCAYSCLKPDASDPCGGLTDQYLGSFYIYIAGMIAFFHYHNFPQSTMKNKC